jgi:hypothetical protein
VNIQAALKEEDSMAGGADEAGDDMVVGRTNESAERTILVTKPTLDYAEDFVLAVGIEGGWSRTRHHQGIDAIHATGAIAEPPSPGGPPPEPAASGVIGVGLNGIVGYPHPVTRDRGLEREAQAGVFGGGGTVAAGVFGRGRTGVVGYWKDTKQDPTEITETAGVFGCGPTGVSGIASSTVGLGPGVHGSGAPGVAGDGRDGLPGVTGDGGPDGGIGVLGLGHDAQGVHGKSEGDRGGIFESQLSHDEARIRAQMSLIPINANDPANKSNKITDPSQLTHADAGDLCVTITQDVSTNRRPIAVLWFCKETSGPAGTPVWVKIV